MPGDAPRHLLAVNSGSSSVKLALFTSGNPPARIASEELEAGEHDATAAHVIAWAATHAPLDSIRAVVHRIVHGGDRFVETQPITVDVIDALTALVPLAPNHLPDQIALIRALQQAAPGVPHIACFDTAFHAGLPAESRTLPIGDVPGVPPVRRYGFHGLSYGFLLERLRADGGDEAAAGRVVLAHLGNGASLAAVRGGKPIDTSMGLTPAGGLVMGTRSGDLDPGVVTYLSRTGHLTVDELDAVLTRESGLRGLSGRSGDMRELLAHEHTDPRARLAIDVFCYQLRKWIGAFAAALHGLDTLVFSGGIGEHAPPVRARACEGLAFLGLEIDSARNAANAAVISTDASKVVVRVIATDEALMMAHEARRVLERQAGSAAAHTPQHPVLGEVDDD